VAAEDSLKQSMEVATKRYSSLFRLPSARKVPLLLSLFCVGGGALTTMILFPILNGLEYALEDGLLLGLSIFFASLVADYIISTLVLKGDAVFDLRRTMALSIFCWAVWMFFVFIGAIVGAVTSSLRLWMRLSLLGFSATLILRFVVFYAASSKTNKRLFAASLLQPFLSLVPFLVLWIGIGYPVTVNMLAFLFSSVIIGFAASFSFLFLLNQMGKQAVGLQSVTLFRAFMLNWVSNLNAPFEELLEKLGEEQEVEVSMMKFGSSEAKTIVVVPSVHPGPFKNIGSSLLPAMLKADLEEKFDCVACVPHGLFGHEYDLASQLQNKKIISEVEACLRGLEAQDRNASPFVKVNNGLATGCCQVFGQSAFISFTLAPKTIEDLPEELDRFVREEVETRGLRLCAIVNAHNSINGTAEMQDSLASLKDVASKCLDKALSLEQSPLGVGAASVLPKEFSLEDGMGSGGITVVVVRSGQQKAAYVVIDGNNMVSGLRERILSSLLSIGIDEGEIFTTDTHAVSALILSEHGYHPVGEAIENERLISYIQEATRLALARLESVGVSCSSITVPNVKVIGAKQLEALCILIDKAIQRAKRAGVSIFGVSGLLLMLLLLFV
jgi:putative membrane protein